jgi:putative oxidoreductase
MRKKESTKTDLALLALRLTSGGLLAGHGAQKLLGWFGGHGLKGTAGWLESLGLRPGKPWALAPGRSEMSGGLMTALGLLNPLGPVNTIGAMSMATAKGHWGKPIWVTAGGAELPLTNVAIATALAIIGPGKYSLDRALGVKLPRWLLVPGVAAALALGAFGVQTNPDQQGAEQEHEQAAQAA